MLTSKHVQPLRTEVANWSEKLKTICDVLELWLEVQEMWMSIEGIFTNLGTIKEMPAEAKRFARVDKSWIKSQKQSYDMKTVIQCCLGSSVQENGKRALLKDIQKELEFCLRTLNSYLERKRKNFPRYYLLSNAALLSLISHSSSLSSMANIRPCFSSLFTGVYDIRLDEVVHQEKLNSASRLSTSSKTSHGGIATPTVITTTNTNTNTNTNMTVSVQYHPKPNDSLFEIPEVYAIDGECLPLMKKVAVEKSAEVWLPRLKDSMQDTLKRNLSGALADVISNLAIEEMALKYPAQVCLLAMTFFWTKEVEACIFEMKNERKLVNTGSKKFAQVTAKLMGILPKSREPVSLFYIFLYIYIYIYI